MSAWYRWPTFVPIYEEHGALLRPFQGADKPHVVPSGGGHRDILMPLRVEQNSHRYRVTLATGQTRDVEHGVEVKVIEGVLTICSEHGAVIVS